MPQEFVSGARGLQQLARALRAAERRDLDAELRRGVDKAIRAIGPAIVAAVPTYMPHGYEPVLAGALRFTTSIRTASVGVRASLVISAMGKTEPRQVRGLEAGYLKHPVFKRKGHKPPWVTQIIRPGFASEPFTAHRPQVIDDIDQAVARVASKIAE